MVQTKLPHPHRVVGPKAREGTAEVVSLRTFKIVTSVQQASDTLLWITPTEFPLSSVG